LQQAEAKRKLSKIARFGEDEFSVSTRYYNGNPPASKIAATTIQSIFDGAVSRFWNMVQLFWRYSKAFDQQFNRLPALEKQVMSCLAMNRECDTAKTARKYWNNSR